MRTVGNLNVNNGDPTAAGREGLTNRSKKGENNA